MIYDWCRCKDHQHRDMKVKLKPAPPETPTPPKAEKKSIEEAAEAAVKLVEEESRQEIEGLAPTETQ